MIRLRLVALRVTSLIGSLPAETIAFALYLLAEAVR